MGTVARASFESPGEGVGANGLVDESRLDDLSRLAAGVTSRRLALGVAAAVGGLVLSGNADAAKKSETSAERWRRKRGRRGRRGQAGPNGPEGPSGPSGPTGPDGPPAGASIVVVSEDCSFPNVGAPGATDGCEAACPGGYVATGGGYQNGTGLQSIGRVIGTRPVLNGQDQPTGWVTDVEYLQIIGFDVTTYVVCVPE